MDGYFKPADAAKTADQESEGFIEQAKKKYKELVTHGKNYKWFCLLFAIGFFFLFLSLCFLPVFFVMPKKTALLFNIGCVCILSSFGVSNGWKEFFINMFFNGERPRNFFAMGFFICMVMCILMALLFDSFIGCLIFLVLEFAMMAYFIASYFPGGVKGVSDFFKMLGNMIKNACTACCKSN